MPTGVDPSQLVLPVRVLAATWLVLVPAAPLLTGLALLVAGERGRSRLGAAASGIASAVAAAAAFSALLLSGLGGERRTAIAVARGVRFLDSGALVVESTLALDAGTALFCGGLSLLVALASFLSFRRGAASDWAAANLLLAGVLLALCADDLVFVCAGWGIAALASWRLGGPSTRGPVLAWCGALLVLLAGAFLFWSTGASSRSPEGRVAKEVSLARLVGEPAAYEIGARRASPVPVGVEESMRLGDATASSATWLVAGPTLSTRALRDLVRVASTGIGARLDRQEFRGIPVLLLVSVLLLLAAAITCVLVPVRAPPTLALTMLPALGAALMLRFDFLFARGVVVTAAAPLVLAACLSVGVLGAIRALRSAHERRHAGPVETAGAAFDALTTIGPMLGGLVESIDRAMFEEGPGRFVRFARRVLFGRRKGEEA